MKTEIFKSNPNLKEVHMTSDGQCFYNDNDAKLHAKTLEDKTVELVMNPTFLVDTEAVDEEELNGGEKSLSEMKPAELVALAKDKFDVELNPKTPKPTLVKQVEKLIEAANAPVVDAPVVDAPEGEAPEGEAPVAGAPKVDAPEGESPVDGGSSIENLNENQE